ncbi:HAD family hydrolase [Edaphobacter dinghuensis]|uniref:phosphoglycolate phosphatase n=1 Tax=Edaphobacter dinghuensis TaxID=1560005 RepID=A0A917M5M6_9BACT|nr:HAD-IA family hydrolase [Edaphobacter dinghuensis]GGG78744.1 hydrolase [Edaphobacter dinghuensis]
MAQDHLFQPPVTVLFDLDGTLLNSLPGIRYSIVEAFHVCGLPMADIDLRSLIGPPIRTILSHLIVETSVQVSEQHLDCLERAFRASYDSEGWQKTYHYADAAAMLKQMNEQGLRLFVVSNKPRHVSLKILEKEGTLKYFDQIITRDSREPRYAGKYEMIRYVLTEQMIQPGDCLMVGDTMEDAEAAAAAGMQFCLMAHGYGDVPQNSNVPVALRLDSFANLMQWTDRSILMLEKEHRVD